MFWLKNNPEIYLCTKVFGILNLNLRNYSFCISLFFPTHSRPRKVAALKTDYQVRKPDIFQMLWGYFVFNNKEPQSCHFFTNW